MNDETDLPCPVCGARNGENQCPLQPQWSDPEAMAHFCSSGLDSDKQDFWEAAVMHYASEGHLVLSRQGERPMTFSAVVHGLIRKGELVSVQKGVNGVGGVGTVVSTMLSIIWKGAVAASSLLWRNNEQNHLSSFSGEDIEDQDLNGRVISPKALHSICESLLDWAKSPKRRRFDTLARLPVPNNTLSTSQADKASHNKVQDGNFGNHCIVSFEELLHQVGVKTPVQTAEEQWIVVHHLLDAKRARLYGEEMVRVGAVTNRGDIASRSEMSADIAYLRLRKSIEACGSLAQKLKIQASDARVQALQLKRSGHLSSALVQMRRYKQRSTELEKVLIKEHALENHLIRLEGLCIDVDFVQTVEVATSALREIRQSGVVDNKTLLEQVDDTILDMLEEQEEQDELADKIGSLALGGAEDDDEELEKELNELLSSDGGGGDVIKEQPPHAAKFSSGDVTTVLLPAASPPLQQSTPPPFPCVGREEEKSPAFTEPVATQKKPMPA